MSLERVEECPLCKQRNFHPLLDCKDHTVTGEVFHVEQCSNCGFVLTNPRPDTQDSARYYQSDSYISHSGKSLGLIGSIYLAVRRLTIKRKYRLLKPYLKSGSLLDVGCGTGDFGAYCQSQGVVVTGIEPSADARLIASKKIEVMDSISKIGEKQFDVVTFWHVIEHIHDLHGTLNIIRRALKDAGTIFIAVPNLESWDAKQYGEYWAAYDVPRHLWHFSKSTMQQFVEQAGLKLIKIVPMKLDAYYVSLLSEKYRASGKQTIAGMIRALWIGFHSNLGASKTVNHSSLIYVVQK